MRVEKVSGYCIQYGAFVNLKHFTAFTGEFVSLSQYRPMTLVAQPELSSHEDASNKNRTHNKHLLRLLPVVVFLILISTLATAQQLDSEEEGQFRFRFVGPKAGNRVSAIAGIPGDASTYYAGAASGGVWKSTDGGNVWKPIFDKQPAAAIERIETPGIAGDQAPFQRRR